MKRYLFLLPLLIFNYLFVSGQYKLPDLPYAYNALEPYIDSTTMRIHHDAHHAAYTNNLNKTLENYPQYSNMEITKLLKNINILPEKIQTAVRNNGGGYYNHLIFWTMLAPAGTTRMSPELEEAIIKSFGSVDAFKIKFEAAAIGRFGSGWVWLIKEPMGELYIESTANQDNMLMPFSTLKGKPILTLDVWEHAYYLKYQSKRAAYVKAFWNVVNWNKVSELYR